MPFAGGHKFAELIIIQIKAIPVFHRESRAPVTMLRVGVFILPHAIVEICKTGNHLRIRPRVLRQVKTVSFHCSPVAQTMNRAVNQTRMFPEQA